jgi:hypothetical protein
MSEQRTKCLRALADFLQSSSCGWWFRVPMLLKTGEETVTVPSDEYIHIMIRVATWYEHHLDYGIVRDIKNQSW